MVPMMAAFPTGQPGSSNKVRMCGILRKTLLEQQAMVGARM
jgi:hypothetical protein